jgi:hypothetical protein
MQDEDSREVSWLCLGIIQSSVSEDAMPLTFPYPVVCTYQTIRILQFLDRPGFLSAVLVREILESRRRLALGSRICSKVSASTRASVISTQFTAKFWSRSRYL